MDERRNLIDSIVDTFATGVLLFAFLISLLIIGNGKYENENYKVIR